MRSALDVHFAVPGFTPRTLEVERELSATRRSLARLEFGDLSVEVRPGADTLWMIVRREGRGGFALRTARNAGPVTIKGRRTKAGGSWSVTGSSGVFTVRLAVLGDSVLRVTTLLTPAVDLLVPYWSRDLYPLDPNDRPTSTRGWVDAAQRGVNVGLCYFCLNEPAFGRVLYLQDLTNLNDYFAATKTKPDGVVGGEWPELGYQPPTAPMGNSPPVEPLKAGIKTTISDALIAVRPDCSTDEQAGAEQFIEMIADIYPHLTRPKVVFHDWIKRSHQTMRSLEKTPEAVVEHYGHKYLHPYVASEYPDSMVQMTVATSLRAFERTFHLDLPLVDQLLAGMPRFFDKKLGTVRRYLPNVGKDKNADAVDSWYLYHPLLNLGWNARWGDEQCKKLFLDSLDFAIQAARHFKYTWPIQYDVTNFSVITPSRNAQGLGQTDVGGLYAYVMLQAHEITREQRFIDEAKAALKALKGARFELVYQTNLSAWGLAACGRLWALERDPSALAQANVFFAGLLHNCVLWDSKIGHARHYNNFFGVTCLHDAPYLAAYECFEAFAAVDEFLSLCGPDLPNHMKMLACEFRKYSLDRGWYFYPDALPREAIETDDIRNGYIDRKLSFPLEDLYGDGQKAGKVGQEIYGCGGAFVFAANGFFAPEDAPFLLFCDYPAEVRLIGKNTAQVSLKGAAGFEAVVRVLKKDRRVMPRIAVMDGIGRPIPAARRSQAFREYSVDGSANFVLKWS